MNELVEYKLDFKKVKDGNFRDFNNQLLFIKCPNAFIYQLNKNEYKTNDQGIFVYGYISKNNGLCFKVIGSGNIDNEKFLHYRNLYQNKKPSIRIREVKEYEYISSLELKNDFSYMETDLNKIIKNEGNCNNTVKRLRKMVILDPFRKKDYPDIVKVKYLNSNKYIWIHYLTYRSEEIYGVAEKNKLEVPTNVIVGFKLKRKEDFAYLKYEGHIIEDIKELA